MGAKLLVVILVAAVVVGGVGYYLYQNYQEESTGSDYSLLDEDKISQGLVCKTVTEIDGEKSESKATVHSVISGTVKYTVDSSSKDSDYKYKGFEDFEPSSYSDVAFDYRDSSAAPTGVYVTSSGNTYTINGTRTTYSGNEYKYDSLKIVLDGSTVTSVNGKMTVTYTSLGQVSTYDMKTTDGVFKCSYKYQGSTEKEKAVSEFFDDVFTEYDPSEFSGLEVKTDEDYRYDGIKVTKLTVNGSKDGTTYKDFEVYVYKDYILKMEGKLSYGGEQHSLKLVNSIYKD